MVDGSTLWGCPKVESEEMQVLGLCWDQAVVQSDHIFGYFRKDGCLSNISNNGNNGGK